MFLNWEEMASSQFYIGIITERSVMLLKSSKGSNYKFQNILNFFVKLPRQTTKIDSSASSSSSSLCLYIFFPNQKFSNLPFHTHNSFAIVVSIIIIVVIVAANTIVTTVTIVASLPPRPPHVIIANTAIVSPSMLNNNKHD